LLLYLYSFLYSFLDILLNFIVYFPVLPNPPVRSFVLISPSAFAINIDKKSSILYRTEVFL